MKPSQLEKFSVTQLKEKLSRAWKKYQRSAERSMAPLLYHLRLKVKAQGKTGAGFGAWVEDTLDISRRTADRWADEWAISQGLKKPSKRAKATFRQVSKSGSDSSGEKVVVTFQMTLTQSENEEWLKSLRVLGSAAQGVVFDAVLDAARVPKKPVASVTHAKAAAASAAQ